MFRKPSNSTLLGYFLVFSIMAAGAYCLITRRYNTTRPQDTVTNGIDENLVPLHPVENANHVGGDITLEEVVGSVCDEVAATLDQGEMVLDDYTNSLYSALQREGMVSSKERLDARGMYMFIPGGESDANIMITALELGLKRLHADIYNGLTNRYLVRKGMSLSDKAGQDVDAYSALRQKFFEQVDKGIITQQNFRQMLLSFLQANVEADVLSNHSLHLSASLAKDFNGHLRGSY